MTSLSTLTEYGHSFQIKLIASLLTDKPFLEQIGDIIEPEYFDSDACVHIATLTRNYFQKYQLSPSIEILATEIKKIDNDLLKESIKQNLKEVFKQFTSSDLTYIKEEALKFCKNQVLKTAIEESVDLLEVGNYDGIKTKIDTAMRAGTEKNIGLDYKIEVKERYEIDKRFPVKTGWDPIDEITSGGLGAGELGIIVGGPGVGKCVGPNTEIEIGYDEIGIELIYKEKEIILWVNPWDSFILFDRKVFGWQLESILIEFNSNSILKRKKQLKIKIKDLFEKLNIPNQENASLITPFPLFVNTPFGFQTIVNLFRTESQPSITLYFSNGKTLKSSHKHRLKVNGEWKFVKDIEIDSDIIETKNGITYLKKVCEHSKNEILYDISVDKVHCYYSNDILSHNSWSLINIAANAVNDGKFVVYYTLELGEQYVAKRFDAYNTGISTQNLKYHLEDIEKKVDSTKGELIIKYFPTKSASVNTISAHLERIKLLKGKPDLIIVDYADLLRGIPQNKNERTDEMLNNLYADLRGLAGQFECPLWSGSQANRCHFLNDLVETRNGKIKIGIIKENDEILTHKGFKKVKKVYLQQVQPVYKIKLKSGKEINISIDHELPTQYGKLKSISTGLKVGDKLFSRKT